MQLLELFELLKNKPLFFDKKLLPSLFSSLLVSPVLYVPEILRENTLSCCPRPHPVLFIEKKYTQFLCFICFPGTYQISSLESAPLGTSLGRIKANDPDVGENAETEYSIADGDGLDIFDIITDKDTQEGIITVKKVYFSSFFFIELSTPGLRFLSEGGKGRSCPEGSTVEET